MQQLLLALSIPGDCPLADCAKIVKQSNLVAYLETELRLKVGGIQARLVPEYAYNGGTNCPHCDGEVEYAASLGAEDGVAWRDCQCFECGKKWTEEYQLVDFEPIEEG